MPRASCRGINLAEGCESAALLNKGANIVACAKRDNVRYAVASSSQSAKKGMGSTRVDAELKIAEQRRAAPNAREKGV